MLSMSPNGAFAQSRAADIANAKNEANEWLTLIDKGDYRQSWIRAASLFRDHITMDRWEEQAGAVRGPMGKLVSRKFKSATYATTMPGAPDGRYVILQYDTSFSHKKSAVETVTPMADKYGQWQVAGYYIR